MLGSARTVTGTSLSKFECEDSTPGVPAVLRPLLDWSGSSAELTLWRPSEASLAHAQMAPPSPIPPSYEQEQHLRAFRLCEQQQEEMARLLIVAWEEKGQCNIDIMGNVIAAHLRRHDTYHSWFEERNGKLVRHVLVDPSTIEMEAVALGEVNAAEWQQHASATASPFAWDCFRFGILQRPDGFTCFASIDHRNSDISILALVMKEIHSAYGAALDGKPPMRLASPGHYLDYCANQRARAASMTAMDPDVTEWMSFLQRNAGQLPKFPLPLGVLEDHCLAEYMTMDLLDERALTAFETVCRASGARMMGGLLACAALTEKGLAGTSRYSVVTLAPTRKSPKAFRTAGWCMGVLPIDFDVSGQSFFELARTAERIFGARFHLANAPVERVLELAADMPELQPATAGGVMLSYSDMSRPPFNPTIVHDWHQTNARVYFNPGMARQVAIWFFKTQRGLTLTAAYPATAEARASMRRYVEALKVACHGAAKTPIPAVC